ncbi:TonB-dependent receptor domain-containing protein [Xanthocytophaga flava]|uniref:TonB-dependent receptor domain-containing protein n=1 Tax=Xanthocytophaga flava TaxID=3048013 RepID=UPI0028D35E30|nr:TonB-dependent receptor [Xanthocytophaga flavus]MDJ1468692.1 TonB-dependent receptor [Xanthocytophaga flavus]
MRKLLLLFTFTLCLTTAFAQTASAPKGNGKITGVILDSTNRQAVSFASVSLLNPATNKPVDGVVSDDKGKFTLSKIADGKYTLSIFFVGYQTKVVPGITISDKNDNIDLGTILVSPSVQLLKEVTVEAQRNIIEEKVDRTVYNAENDATNKGGDATDVLRKVPMLSVDLDGNVSLRGSQNIKVLINNRPSTITAGSVADALKQIPSDLIKSVEVITSPSAKYDAEGSGGIINIITKKNTLSGFSLNTDASAGTRGSNLGLRGSYRKGKMGFSLGGFGRYGYNVNGNFNSTQQTYVNGEPNYLTKQSAYTRNNFLFGHYNLGWDYDINDNNFLSASVQYGARNRDTYQDGLSSQTFAADTLNKSLLQDVHTKDLSGTVDVNLNYTHNFKKPQQEFSILTQYSRNNQTNDFVNSLLSESDESVESRRKNLNKSYNQEITIQMDYQNPIGKSQMLEVGAKEIIRKVTSDYQTLTATGATGAYVLSTDTALTNVFSYNQKITSGYLSYTYNLPKNYSLKAGARYEYTTIDAAMQKETEAISIPSYGVLVPSLNLSKKLKNGNMVKAAYNRRIQRPSLQFLNPNRQSSNQLNITVGNPDLKPEYTNNFELSYSTNIKSTSLNFSTFMRNTNNVIGPLRSAKGDTIITTYQNVGTENAYGFSVFVNINLSNRLSLNGGTDAYYSSLNNGTYSNQGWVYNIRGFGNYTLGKGWGIQAFGFYRGRQVQLQGFQSGFGIYSLSIKKDFANKRGSIGFGAENFLTPANRMRVNLTSADLVQSSVTEMHNMSFKVNISYRFGKISANEGPRRSRKSITNDDLKEGGDNTGAQQQGGGAPQGQGGGTPQGPGAGPGGAGKPSNQLKVPALPQQKTDSTMQKKPLPVLEQKQ